MKIKGFIGTSLLDYPKKICSIIFLAGCNFKCPFCQNPDLIGSANHIKTIPLTDIIDELKIRKNFIEGVVISGGEPTIYNNLEEIILPIKRLDYSIKIDTNGYNPELIEELIRKKIVDYVAMDIKTSFDRYNEAAGCRVNIEKLKKTIEIIKKYANDYEFRTTVVPTLINEEDIKKIAKECSGAKAYYLHQYRSIITFDKSYQKIEPYDVSQLIYFKKILLSKIPNVQIRGL